MATPYIVVGCPTTGGGQVISGNSSFLIEGIPIACVGDKATCPKHKTVATIVAGDPNMQVMGKAAARVNDPLSCGCKLLPKQSLVVQDNAGGFGSGYQQNSRINSNEERNNFVEDKNNFDIELQRISIKKNSFVPLGVQNADGQASIDKIDFEIKAKKGVFEYILLEVEKSQGEFELIERIPGPISSVKGIKVSWDGFINNIYDSKKFTSANGLNFRVRGFAFNKEQCKFDKNVKFKYYNNWLDVHINKKNNTVNVKLRINLKDGGAMGLQSSNDIPAVDRARKTPITSQIVSFEELRQFAIQGIHYYWSRKKSHPTGKNVLINGSSFEVIVNPFITSDEALPEMTLFFATNGKQQRSINAPILLRRTFFNVGWDKFPTQIPGDSGWRYLDTSNAVKDFKETFAHEMGHAILRAYGGQMYSNMHKGSSTVGQSPIQGSRYPNTGEIDLMKYAEGNKWGIIGYFDRMVASEKDVIGLIYLSRVKI